MVIEIQQRKIQAFTHWKNNLKNEYLFATGQERIKLEESDLEKDLGIYIDPNLNFKKHIKNTVKKSSFTSNKILKKLYFQKS